MTRIIDIRLADPSDLEPHRLKRLSDLINDVYGDAEAGMWIASASRTHVEEVRSFILAGSLILAEIDGSLAGCVRVTLLDDEVAEFGMLVTDFSQRGQGVGSALVAQAEEWARQQGCRTMQLEILTPRSWKNESKEFLKRWYTQLEYRPVETQPFETMYADLSGLLQTECDFTVWHKSLV